MQLPQTQNSLWPGSTLQTQNSLWPGSTLFCFRSSTSFSLFLESLPHSFLCSVLYLTPSSFLLHTCLPPSFVCPFCPSLLCYFCCPALFLFLASCIFLVVNQFIDRAQLLVAGAVVAHARLASLRPPGALVHPTFSTRLLAVELPVASCFLN